MAAEPGAPSVPQLLHGMPGGCSDAGSLNEERPAWAAQNGGQLSQVRGLKLETSPTVRCLHYL